MSENVATDVTGRLFGGGRDVSTEKIEFFETNGYVRFDDVLSEEEVEALRDDMDDAIARRDTFSRDIGSADQTAESKEYEILQMLNLWRQYPNIRAYVFGERTASIARHLTGSSSIRLYHDQALVKPPHSHSASPWHQDQPYWPTRDAGMLSCWMALDDVTVERGCMHFIPGSQKWGELPPISFTGDGPALEEVLSEAQQQAWNPVPVELKAGSCTFHHGLTFHYTRPNETDRVRRALVTIYIPDWITYAGDDKMETPFDETITSKKGEVLQGELFRLLL